MFELNNAVVKILLIFLVTQLLGLYVGAELIENSKIIPEFNEFSVAPIKDVESPLNPLILIGYILLGAGVMLVIIKYYKGVMLFKLIEFAVVFAASNIVFFVLFFKVAAMPQIGNVDPDMLVVVTLVVSLLFAIAKFIVPSLKNAAAVIASAGVGAIFGFSIGFYPTLILIFLLAAYDYIAVFKTRHMITMARELDVRDLSFAITAKEKKKVKIEKMVGKKKVIEEVEREGARLDLGTGDLSIPAMLAVSAYGYGGMFVALAGVVGTSAAIYILLKFVNERRVFLPALPPICFGGVMMIFLAKLAGF